MLKKENREPLILPDFSCHHLRHTFCTRLCENESNLKVIQTIMGHKKYRDYYGHICRSDWYKITRNYGNVIN